MSKRYMFLEINEESHSVMLLGYELKLSPTDFDILNIIFDDRPVSAELILQGLQGKISKKSLPVHINSINKKAFAISGKKFIVHSVSGYCFAKNI